MVKLTVLTAGGNGSVVRYGMLPVSQSLTVRRNFSQGVVS